jgi:hypothetical protein
LQASALPRTTLLSVQHRDWIQRLIEQVGEALARAAGLARKDQHAEALDCIRQAQGQLRIVPGLIDHSDPEALFELLGPEQSRALGQLLAAEAEALSALGREPFARRARERSRQLLRLIERAADQPADGS